MEEYVIRVRGRLSDDAVEACSGLSMSTESIQTVLEGTLPDQAALTGVLDYLSSIGVDIVEISKKPPGLRPA